MALRTILTTEHDEEALRKHSRPVTVFNERLHKMIDDMVETLRDSGGVGLAAPQVGILRRIVVIEREDGSILELVNPEVIATEGEQTGTEGCLSLPGVWGMVTRPMTVTVKAQDRNGEPFTETASGLIGRCFVHECEHLDGVLFTDRADHILTNEELEAMDEAAEEVKTASRRYAKRQLSWLRGKPEVHWYLWKKETNYQEACQFSTHFLEISAIL